MIEDFRPERKKPKVINPLPTETKTPLQELMAGEPAFKTPEEAAATDNEPARDQPTVSHHAEPPKAHHHWWPHTKRQKIIGSVVAILVAFGIGAAWTIFIHHTPPTKAAVVQPPPAKPAAPTTVPNTLTGLPVKPDVNERPVTGVMIENSPDARPQSGLDQAGVVFEAIAEGGITRFLALYQDTQPNYLGPVRSSRPYYLEWALGFDAGYAHVGGSPEALRDIKSWHVRDLDQFFNSLYYHRITTRYAPHNVYTSIAELNKLEDKKGYTHSTFTGFARKPDQPYQPPETTQSAGGSGTTATANQDSRTPASSINMTFSGYYYNTHYTYNAKTNNYTRYEGGAKHLELTKTGKKVGIYPKVLVAMIMPYSLEADGYHSDYDVIGSGRLYVFQDGTVQTGTWHKASRTTQLTFTDASGNPLKLDAGQTWISALATTADIHYKK